MRFAVATMNSKAQNKAGSIPQGLVGAKTLLEIIWPCETDRPSLRFLRELQAKRLIPYRKISRMVFFDPEEVRRSLDAQFKVESLG